jgi:hypothetical protein
MSTVGSFRYFLPLASEEAAQYGDAVYDHVIATGDLRAIAGSHTCQMYRWRDVGLITDGAAGKIVAASASNWMSLGDPEVVAAIEGDAERRQWFLDWEDPEPRPGLRERLSGLTGQDKARWRPVR